MKVLHVAETIKGGIASYLNDLLFSSSILFPKYQVTLLIPDTHFQDINIEILANYVQIKTFKKRKNRVFSSLLMLLECLKVIFSQRPDVIHIHSTFAGFFLRAPIRLLVPKINIVYCSHGWAFDRCVQSRFTRFIIWSEKFFSYFSDKIICISGHDYELACSVGIAKKKLTLIPNGILDAPGFNIKKENIVWPEGKIRVLFVGRFDYQKGIDVFFDALRQIPNAHAYVIGDKVLKDDSIYQPADNCTLLGWLPREQIQNYYESADVLVITSRWEGFGLIATEAMRSGLAVIASNVGGLKDIIINGKTGYLVQPGDSKEIVRLLSTSSPEKFKALGKEGYFRFKENFVISRVVNALDSIYKQP